MTKHARLAALAFAAMAAAPASAAERTVTLAIANMSCATCAPVVRQSLSAVRGVSKVVVSVETNTAVVTFDDEKTTVAALIAAPTNAGYPARLATDGAKTQ